MISEESIKEKLSETHLLELIKENCELQLEQKRLNKQIDLLKECLSIENERLNDGKHF